MSRSMALTARRQRLSMFERKEMIEEIVSSGNAAKHFPHCPGVGDLVSRALGHLVEKTQLDVLEVLSTTTATGCFGQCIGHTLDIGGGQAGNCLTLIIYRNHFICVDIELPVDGVLGVPLLRISRFC
jgi:hypothetical protein